MNTTSNQGELRNHSCPRVDLLTTLYGVRDAEPTDRRCLIAALGNRVYSMAIDAVTCYSDEDLDAILAAMPAATASALLESFAAAMRTDTTYDI